MQGCGKGGIGEALVKEYARRNVHPIATVLPTESSEHLSQAGITWFPLDVTVEESVADLKRNVLALTGGRLDILVNNAGICYTMTAIDTEVTSVKRMFDVNVFGPMQMVHHFHDMIIRASGAIVNIGSIGGVVPYVYGASYNASKAALHHWSNTLRLEMSPFNPATETASPETTDRFEYAANVVAQSLRSSPSAWFWYGSATSIIRFFDTFAWPLSQFWSGLRKTSTSQLCEVRRVVTVTSLIDEVQDSSEPSTLSSVDHDVVCIAGMACRLPGGISSPSELRDFLHKKKSAQCSVPPERFNIDCFYHPDGGRAGAMNTNGGYFLKDDVRLFDNDFFGINNLEATYMDPQQRKLLEAVFECFENAGVPMEDMFGSNTAVYVGNFIVDYQAMQSRDPDYLHRKWKNLWHHIAKCHDAGGDYVECHGTATAVGDPLGVDGLASCFTPREVSLASEHGIIPPTYGVKNLNPKLKLEARNMKVLNDNEGWPLALRPPSINSFGYGGANAHVIHESIDSYLDKSPQAINGDIGAQYAGMARELLKHNACFLASIREIDQILQYLPSQHAPSWTFRQTILGPPDVSKVNDVARSQPLCTAVQIALIELLCSWGVSPSAVIGHSSGEIAAYYSTGLLTAPLTILPVYFRGFAVGQLQVRGAMLAAGVSVEAANALIQDKDLPTFPWDYSKGLLWYEPRASVGTRNRKHLRHELLEVPWMRDHRLESRVVFPGAGYVAAAIETISQVRGLKERLTKEVGMSFEGQNTNISAPLIIHEEDDAEVQNTELHTVVRQRKISTANVSTDWYEFSISSWTSGQSTLHCTGSIRVVKSVTDSKQGTILATGTEGYDSWSMGRWYEKSREEGLCFELHFQSLTSLHTDSSRTRTDAVATTQLDPPVAKSAGTFYAMHPITIDACLQASIMGGTAGNISALRAFVPVFIFECRIQVPRGGASRLGSEDCKIHTRMEKTGFSTRRIDYMLRQPNGTPAIDMRIVRLSLYTGKAPAQPAAKIREYIGAFAAQQSADMQENQSLVIFSAVLDLAGHKNLRMRVGARWRDELQHSTSKSIWSRVPEQLTPLVSEQGIVITRKTEQTISSLNSAGVVPPELQSKTLLAVRCQKMTELKGKEVLIVMLIVPEANESSSTVEALASALGTRLHTEDMDRLRKIPGVVTNPIWLTGANIIAAPHPDLTLSNGLSRALMLEQPSLGFTVFDLGATDFAKSDIMSTTCENIGPAKLSIDQVCMTDTMHFQQISEPLAEPPAGYVDIDLRAVSLNSKDIYAMSGRTETHKTHYGSRL
ncbi:hypothetical protein DL767_000968 [Monosporascus sp. MG133]|nr:hypothetical protein DL767_000968 [Monosporascus sp. MG133]